MNLYYVTNGYYGDGQVHVYVIAENEERAKELAAAQFKDSARNEDYPESYWTNLKAHCMTDDTSKEFVTDVRD